MGTQTLTNPEPWQDAVAEEMRGRFFGRYLGFVRDVDDPERRGRIRASCPQLLPGAGQRASEWLDWLLPGFAGLAVPPLLAPVWISFEQGQIQYGVYTWGWLRGTTPATSDAPAIGREASDPTLLPSARNDATGQGKTFGATITADPAIADPPKYPEVMVFEQAGHILELDRSTTAPRARYRHPSGTTLLVDPDGSVHIRAVGAIYQETTNGDYVINLGKGCTFKVVYPDGSALALGASGFVVTGYAASILGRTVLNTGGEIR